MQDEIKQLSQVPWDSLVAQLVKNPICNVGDPGSIPGSGRYAGEGIGYSLQYSWASWWLFFGKKSPCSAEDLGSIPGLARSPGGGLGNPPHGYSTWGCKQSDMT